MVLLIKCLRLVEIKVRFEGQVQAKDQEVLVYGAPHLKTVSGMEGMMPRHLLLNNATKLTNVECPGNTELINVQMEKCSYLQRVDLSGCTSLGTLNTSQVLDVSGCNNLRYLNAYDTVITSININQAGGNLVELYVPKTLQTLSLRNQYSLKIVGIPGSSTLETSKVRDLVQNASNIASFTMINCPLVERLSYESNFTASSTFFDNYANERRGAELAYIDYTKDEWKRLMQWGNGLANCNSIYIENSCYNVPSMSFRGTSKLTSLTLRAMPGLKTLMLGANCCGYRNEYYSPTYDTYAEFDWDQLIIRDCPALEEFRIHEMYSLTSEGQNGNLTYFTFKPGTDTINLAEKFPNLKIFECNLATQNIHQIILPQSLKSMITCAWNERHDEGFINEVKIERFNIDSIFFEGEQDYSFVGIDLGNHKLENTRIIAPYATQLLGVDITNTYVNPIFNDLKEAGSDTRFYITPNGRIDVSNFQWTTVSDWFAFMDFTLGECDVKTPDNWTTFLRKVTKANRMFYHCTNPEFTWDFAMKFFPKINTVSDLSYMYQYAQLAEQQDFDADGVELTNTYDIGGYNYGATPFEGSNLKFVKSINLSRSGVLYAMFQNCSSLEKVGDINLTGNRNTASVGMDNLFSNCSNLKEVGNITSYFNRQQNTAITTQNMFEGCYSLVSVGELDINSSSISSMYNGCTALPNSGLSLPGMKLATDMRNAFANCRELTEITFETLESMIYANSAFRGCFELKKIVLNGLKESSPLQDMGSMFSNCYALTDIVMDGATLPLEVRTMSGTFENCTSLVNLPPLANFTYDVNMNSCCANCTSLTDDTMYKVIPFKVITMNSMYVGCTGLKTPTIDINADHILAKQVFYNCGEITELTINFNGRLLRNSVDIAASCGKLEVVNFKFPDSVLMDEYYGTGTSHYTMFRLCQNLRVVNLDMDSLANTNTKTDLGSMLAENRYVEEINGLDLTYLKKPLRAWTTNGGQSSYDYHDPSVTYGTSYENLTTFGLKGILSNSYDFKNITSLEHTKNILRHLDTVTNETLGLTYNVMDAIDDEKTEEVDQELKSLALDAINRGWTFAIV